MGKYARQKKNNCKGIGEIEVMEVQARDVGVRTRARALSVANSKAAKKKSKYSTASLIQLRSHRRPASPTASCCSSNACSDVDVGCGSAKVVDLEDDAGFQIETSTTCNLGNQGRRKTTPSSENQAKSGDLQESMARQKEANSSSVGVTPFEFEVDEFFAAAEKDLQKRFTDKYNYDVAKDMPLGGRYEWIPLKPKKEQTVGFP